MICKNLAKCAESEFSKSRLNTCDNSNHAVCIVSSDNRSKIRCEEKKKSYILENTLKKHIINYKMDGGIIVTNKTVPEGINKCDHLFVANGEKNIAILIELKGSDFPKAIKQLNSTLVLYQDFFKKCSNVYGRIVGTSTAPKLKATSNYVKLTMTIHNNYDGNIKTGEHQMVEKDTELDIVK